MKTLTGPLLVIAAQADAAIATADATRAELAGKVSDAVANLRWAEDAMVAEAHAEPWREVRSMITDATEAGDAETQRRYVVELRDRVSGICAELTRVLVGNSLSGTSTSAFQNACRDAQREGTSRALRELEQAARHLNKKLNESE